MSVHGPLLTVNKLEVKYGRRPVLSDVSLEVFPGEIVALFGANGSGKSTLLKAIAGLIPIASGDVQILGTAISERAESARLCEVGLLLQGGQVFKNLTIKEHLQLAVGTSKSEIDPQTTIRGLFPQIWETQNKNAGLLSAGERQMLAMSMLLLQNKPVWLLDEPSGGLAPAFVRISMDLIASARAKSNKTVLLAEQNIGEALRIADRVYILKDGKTFSENRPRRADEISDISDIEVLL